MDIAFAGFTLKAQERLLVAPSGPVELGTRAIDVLRLLLSSPNEVVSKDTLLSEAWHGTIVEENALQAQVSALRKVLGTDMIVTVHGRGYKYAGPLPVQSTKKLIATVPDEERKPVVVVLPFTNLSDDRDQKYLSEGIAEDIADRLSLFRVLDVIGRHSAAAILGMDLDIREVGSRLHADYVVTGNLQRAAGRIRIAARLTEAKRGTVLWAERYDRGLEDVFEIQDDVAATIASRLSRHVEVGVAARVQRGSDFNSYELALKGMMHFRSELLDGHVKAAEYFRRALEINANCVEGMRGLSGIHIARWLYDYDRHDLDMALDYARRGSEIDPTNADCFGCLGLAQTWASGVDAAAPAFRRAMEINPGDSYVLADASVHAIYGGRLGDAHALIDEAYRLNPIPPRWFSEYRGLLDFAEGRYSDAANAFHEFISGKYQMTYYVACLGYLGDRLALASAASHVEERGMDLTAVASAEPYREPRLRERLIDGLSRATSGTLPE
ncbi:MAG: winged helix-turn-helix domain-containing protein [Hyphomicrobiales bacterium]